MPIKKDFLKNVLINKKIKPSAEEISINPRSRSAKINVLGEAIMNLTYSFLLIILITVSAFSVIFIKYQNRMLNIEISQNEKNYFTFLSHIEIYFRKKLKLQIEGFKKIV